MEQPFGKPADTIVHEQEPFNAEPPRGALGREAITPVERFYVRGHGAVPAVPADASLRVEGLVDEPLELSLEQLRDGRFAQVEVTATLQCAGNRRVELVAIHDIPGEASWGSGATGTAVWRGVRLADVIAAAGPRPDARHVAFVGAERAEEAKPPQRFGGSVPLEKALRPEVVLAWEMDGAPLPSVHGGPLRVVVPGYIGARSVKWLQQVELRADPFDGYFQETAYRLIRPGEQPAPGLGIELGEILLNADILSADDEQPRAGSPFELRGYALAGGGRSVARVEVSCDGGETWKVARLLEDLGPWAWRLWSLRVELPAGDHQIFVRAWDTSGGTQPESPDTVWNPKGYMNTSWGRMRITVAPTRI
ncbi:MAG TPA: sulfite oxidase [Gaiellaceae bacterium]|nr:sulfite oxidase [Gaiellaceae bacterium]